MTTVQIEPSWKTALAPEFEREYFRSLSSTVRSAYQQEQVFPPPIDVFRAFNLCPISSVKVVIVGQDPYHGPGQANGLCFAVGEGQPLPPSLVNIFKEIESDLGVTPINSGDLSRWAAQGILMLNSVLTVLANRPASHQGLGWEVFTDAVIHTLSEQTATVVYLLWGKYAQNKGAHIDRAKNLVLESAHPSPFSATGFFGHHHFSQCNTYLTLNGLQPIDWR